MSQVKERPMLFNGSMVRAMLDDSKTQTRRVVKPEGAHHLFQFRGKTADAGADEPTGDWGWCGSESVVNKQIRCPYGVPGDRFWVRETFFAYGRWVTQFNAKKGRDEWRFVDMTLECGHAYHYDVYDNDPLPIRGKRDAGVVPGWWKRPSMFMPRAASRITLEITGVRVERLQDITPEDCIAEGVGGMSHSMGRCDLITAYAELWNAINGPGSWATNLWIWVIKFKRLKP